MQIINLLHYSTRAELRQWLEDNHNKEKCCWVVMYRHWTQLNIERCKDLESRGLMTDAGRRALPNVNSISN